MVLKCSPLNFIQIETANHLEIISKKTSGSTFVYLDKISDPHNLGAIVRTCYFLGVDGIIVDEHRRCPLTPTVSRTSAGALELTDIFCVPDPVEFFTNIKKDKWRIHAAVAESIDENTEEKKASKRFDKSVDLGYS